MKQGMDLQELAAEIERQAGSKRDYIAPTNKLSMDAMAEDIAPVIKFETDGGEETFGIGPYAHRDLGSHVGIPYQYYDRMLAQAPHLLAQNVNHWLQTNESPRMVRTLDNNVRAILSDRYRPLDNNDLAEAVLPVILAFGMRVESCAITERKLYIKAFRSDMSREIAGSAEVGDIVEAGICIMNSEIGAGSLAIMPMIYRLACENGQISQDHTLRKTHAGRRHSRGDMEVAMELLSDDTKRQIDKGFWMSVKDLTRQTLDGEVFEAQVQRIEIAAGNKIEGKLEAVVEVTATKFSLTETEQDSVLKNLIEGKDLSQWGLANALTRTSQVIDDYDRATEFERFGGEVIELPKHDWEVISTAKKAA